MRRFEIRSAAAVLPVSMWVGACFVSNPDYLGVQTTHEDSIGSDENEDENENGGEGTEEGEDGDGGGHPGPSCGDGIAAPGDFCFSGVTLLALNHIRALALADFDGDGLQDLAVARQDDVLVLFGDGHGKFPGLLDLPEADSNYMGVVAGDIDFDGDDDLIVARYDENDVSVYRSNGDRTFEESVQYATGGGPTAMVLVRLGSGDAYDLAVICEMSDAVDVLYGAADGSFAKAISYPAGGEPMALGVGLIDGDAHLDLLIANRMSKTLELLVGLGDGAFMSGLAAPTLGRPRASVLADFDGDGALDAATVVADLDRAQLLFGDGLGGLVDSGQDLVVGQRPLGAAVGDFNNDGHFDLVVANHDDDTTGLLRGSADAPGQLESHELLPFFADVTVPRAVVVGDLNGDGVDDLVVGGKGLSAMVSNP